LNRLAEKNGDIMRLQISTRLAIFAILEITARENSQISVADIGEKYSVSSHHLAKVMHVMGRAGLVRSVRGAGGGYRFAGNARRTTLLDVVQLFEDLNSVEQDTGAADATPEGQTLRTILNEIDEIARATLGSITIATMRKLVDRRGARRDARATPASARKRSLQRRP
jgi:Rrf2 family transcriptional regulator, nitric oxide-sensitive transcriptional repressor